MSDGIAPRKSDENPLRDRINRSLDAALEEAERVGYVSADENERRMREFMARLKQRVAAGEIKP